MSRTKTLQDLFKRYRRPGDMVMAAGSFVFAVALLTFLPSETVWVKKTKLFAQPAFWPSVAIVAMVLFSGMHFVGALVSERIPGRWDEVKYWLRSLEFVGWFLAYVAIVPVLGYLPSTILFTCTLAFRMGYRSVRWIAIAAGFAICVVLVFKGFLQVKIPSGAVYEYLPSGGFRTFVMTWF